MENYEEFELLDKPSTVEVSVAIVAAVGDLPEHYIRSRHMKFNGDAKRRISNRLERGEKVTRSDIDAALIKNDSSGTKMTHVAVEGGWREKRYNIALVVQITEYNGVTPVSSTVRTIMGWVRDDPSPIGGLPDSAIININTVVTRDVLRDGTLFGTIRNTSKLTGTSSDELPSVNKKVLMGANISSQIQFQSDYHSGNVGGGFTSTVISDDYSTDTKVSGLAADSTSILVDAINNSLFDTSSEPIGVRESTTDVDDFILLLNSFTTNSSGHQTGLKSFTWGAFKEATKWSNYNKLEVYDTPAAPIFNPAHSQGSTESIEHNTNDTYINDIGFPLVHAICTLIEKYGLALLNLTFNWINGIDSIVYASIARPLDNSELKPMIVEAIESEARTIFDRFTTIMGVEVLEVVFDGGFGKSSGISLRVNSAPTPIPLVVSPAQTSLYNESIVESQDNRITNATATAIGFIMHAHGKQAGDYKVNSHIQEPMLASPVRDANQTTTKPRQLPRPSEDASW